MIKDPDVLVVWNMMGLTLVSCLIAFIVLIIQRSQKRILAEVNERYQHTVKAQEEERLRIAANIHDDLVSQIHRLRLTNHKLEEREKLDKQLRNLLSSARSVSHQLSPPMPETVELQELIDDYLVSLGGDISVLYRADIRGKHLFNAETNMHLFRIVQELITNVYKHAHAQKLELLLRVSSSYVCLLATDDGIGFSQSVKRGLGMQNIEFRTKLLKAYCKFKSLKGTTFILVLPLDLK